MDDPNDPRIIPEPLAGLSEDELFDYYRTKAKRALAQLDGAPLPDPEAGPASFREPEAADEPAASVRAWREKRERGEPKIPAEMKSELAAARNHYYGDLRQFEANVGKAVMEAFEEGPDAAAKTWQAIKAAMAPDAPRTAPKRILERRILKALNHFFHENERVPANFELLHEVGSHPISDAKITVSRRGKEARIQFPPPNSKEATPKRVSKKQFREALANLQLGDLPKGKPGNPNFQ